ncbi:MAG: hypothetical protein AB7V77_01775 [Candidatus Woesearchaeota archaeon]
MMGKILAGVTILTLSTGAYIGEKYKPIENISNFFKYHNVIASETTPRDFWNYTTKLEIDSNNVATLYFGNLKTNEFKQVKTNGDVGGLGENIDKYIEEKKQQLNQSDIYISTKKQLKTFKNNIKEQFEKLEK